MLTHAARAAAKQLNKVPFHRHLWWPRAARAKGSGQSNQRSARKITNQVLTHAARAAHASASAGAVDAAARS